MKKICIVSDCYVPLPISASGMIYNLSKYLYDKNFNILCIHGASKKTIDYDSLFNENRNKNIDFINTKLLQSFRSKNHVFSLF